MLTLAKRFTFWFADLWPVSCIACIYLRFVAFGFLLGVVFFGVVLAVFVRTVHW
jgi:hypothetical protein